VIILGGSKKILQNLVKSITECDDEAAFTVAKRVIEEGIEPIEAIEHGIAVGLKKIGDDYERVFVPRLLKDYSKKDNIYFGLPLEICIWLPTQDQLQEMSGYQWNDFDDECLRIDQKLNEIIPTKEQAGLMVYMRDWHNKTWDGEKWI